MTFLRSAHLYDLLYDTIVDYDARAAEIHDAIHRCNPDARTLLDVGCGTGPYLERLRQHYEVAGVDIEPGMVDLCAARLPGVPVAVADMAELDVGRRFGTRDGIEHIAERHEMGLFSRADYIEACSDARLRDVRAYDGPTGAARPRVVATSPAPPPG